MSEKPVTMKFAVMEWGKLVGLIVAQLVAVVIYVQKIDHKAETAKTTAIEARAEIRELREKTDTKLDRLDSKIDGINEKVNKTNDGVTRIQATLERRVP